MVEKSFAFKNPVYKLDFFDFFIQKPFLHRDKRNHRM